MLGKQEVCEKSICLLAERIRAQSVRIFGGTSAGAGQREEWGTPKRHSMSLKRSGVDRHCSFLTKSTTKRKRRRWLLEEGVGMKVGGYERRESNS